MKIKKVIKNVSLYEIDITGRDYYQLEIHKTERNSIKWFPIFCEYFFHLPICCLLSGNDLTHIKREKEEKWDQDVIQII